MHRRDSIRLAPLGAHFTGRKPIRLRQPAPGGATLFDLEHAIGGTGELQGGQLLVDI